MGDVEALGDKSLGTSVQPFTVDRRDSYLVVCSMVKDGAVDGLEDGVGLWKGARVGLSELSFSPSARTLLDSSLALDIEAFSSKSVPLAL